MNNLKDSEFLIQEFSKLLNSKKLNKLAADEGSAAGVDDMSNESDEALMDPERFLLNEEKLEGNALNKAIDSVSSYGDDGVVPQNTPDLETQHSSVFKQEDDVGYLIDQRAVKVLNGLGKIAASLRKSGKDFPADVVEVTAVSIRNDLIKEASEKLNTILELKKIASNIQLENPEDFSIDLIEATISRIKTAGRDEYGDYDDFEQSADFESESECPMCPTCEKMTEFCESHDNEDGTPFKTYRCEGCDEFIGEDGEIIYTGPSDHQERMHERSQMGLTDFADDNVDETGYADDGLDELESIVANLKAKLIK